MCSSDLGGEGWRYRDENDPEDDGDRRYADGFISMLADGSIRWSMVSIVMHKMDEAEIDATHGSGRTGILQNVNVSGLQKASRLVAWARRLACLGSGRVLIMMKETQWVRGGNGEWIEDEYEYTNTQSAAAVVLMYDI